MVNYVRKSGEGMSETAIQTINVSVAYGNHVALEGATVDIPKGTRTAILGPNGAGKSTLIKGVLGLEPIRSGSVCILGETEELKKVISQKVAYVPQLSTINWQFPATIYDIVMMGRFCHIIHPLKKPSKKDKEIVMEAIEKMKLTHLVNRSITELSGGERKRVFLARAIAQDAEIYLMDEPLASVDIQTEHIIMDLLKQFQREGKTSIVVHHDLNTVSQYFDFIVWVNKTVIASGPMEAVMTEQYYHKAYQSVFKQDIKFRMDQGNVGE